MEPINQAQSKIQEFTDGLMGLLPWVAILAIVLYGLYWLISDREQNQGQFKTKIATYVGVVIVISSASAFIMWAAS